MIVNTSGNSLMLTPSGYSGSLSDTPGRSSNSSFQIKSVIVP